MSLSVDSNRLYLCSQVSSVTTTDTDAPVKYAYNTMLVTEEYQVA